MSAKRSFIAVSGRTSSTWIRHTFRFSHWISIQSVSKYFGLLRRFPGAQGSPSSLHVHMRTIRYWPRFLGRDNTMHSWQSHQSGRTPNLSLKLQTSATVTLIRYRRISDQAQFQSFAHSRQGIRGGSFGITLVSAAFARTHSS